MCIGLVGPKENSGDKIMRIVYTFFVNNNYPEGVQFVERLTGYFCVCVCVCENMRYFSVK